MPHITVTIGIPGSGKSTWAKEQVKKNGNTVIVCRDDLRDQLFGGLLNYKFSKKREDLVTATAQRMVITAVESNQNVIIADTNINTKVIASWRALAKQHNASFGIHDMFSKYRIENSDVEETSGIDGLFERYVKRCHEWNLKRLHTVPSHVIDDMFERYKTNIMGYSIPQHVHHEGLPKAVIFDVDGTLSHMHNLRSPFEWKKVGVDHVDSVVAELVQLYSQAGYTIIVMSGRDSVCRYETAKWLSDNHIHFDKLFMRKEGDQRNDATVKQELFMTNVDGVYNVHACFDDRDRVVARWRAMGIKCLQCEPGNF